MLSRLVASKARPMLLARFYAQQAGARHAETVAQAESGNASKAPSNGHQNRPNRTQKNGRDDRQPRNRQQQQQQDGGDDSPARPTSPSFVFKSVPYDESVDSVDLLFDNLDKALAVELRPHQAKNMKKVSLAAGHSYLTRLHDLNAGNDNVPDSILNKRLIAALAAHGLLHASHIDRALRVLFNERQFSKALSQWIESLEFFKANPDRLTTSGNTDELVIIAPYERFFIGGIVSYLLSLIENKAKLDPEFVKLILKDHEGKRIGAWDLKTYMQLSRIPKEDISEVLNLWKEYRRSEIDFNEPVAWAEARNAALYKRSAEASKLIDQGIRDANARGIKLSLKTWAEIMSIYNLDRNYPKALQAWKEALASANSTKDLPIELWNQFLLSHVSSNSPQKQLRIESAWKLLNDNSKPDSESYRFLIKGFLACKFVDKALKTVTELKKNHPGFMTNLIKEDLVVGLLENGFAEEGDRLFKGYQGDKDFKPSMVLYNQILHHYLHKNDLHHAAKVLDSLLNEAKTNRKLKPDVATWTTIIDLLLKQSQKLGTSKEEIFKELNDILTAMSHNGIQLNEASLTMLVTNLMKDPKTAEMGAEMFNFMRKNEKKLGAIAYSSMISRECEANHMNAAVKLFNDGLEAGIELTPRFYNMILKGYCDHPDIVATGLFYQFIKRTATRPDQKPNFFSFYYIMREALFLEDDAFLKYIVKELDEADLNALGRGIPNLLLAIENRGIEVPPRLKQKGLESRRKAEEAKQRAEEAKQRAEEEPR